MNVDNGTDPAFNMVRGIDVDTLRVEYESDAATVAASGAMDATKGHATAPAPTASPAPVARNRKSRLVP